MKIQLKAVKLTKQIITKITEFHLELHEKNPSDPASGWGETFEYIACFEATEFVNPDDELMGVKSAITHFKVFGYKKDVVAIEISFVEHANVWLVALVANGFSNDIKMYFKKQEEAESVYEILKKWKP
jgi:hypothetical protein